MDLEYLVNIDRQLLQAVNGANNMFLDTLMLTLTSGVTWVPLYVALLYMVVKNKETAAQVALVVAGAALCFAITEVVTEGIVKLWVARPRPCSDPMWMDQVHVVNGKRKSDFSFFSAHAANTFGIAVFFAWMVRNKVFTWLMVTWSLVNCYTRLYLAMHYPSDIFVGLVFGALVGSLTYLAYWLVEKKGGAKQHYVSSQYTSTGYAIADIDVVAFVLVAIGIAAIIISLMMH
ncbi:MAG: phosphatase PAP2 family protein [Prevotella sp.]|nr:phosphatase PAP2 family protein [Prevotella sp.]